MIAGVVGGSIAFLLLLALIIFLVVRSRRNRNKPVAAVAAAAANPVSSEYAKIPQPNEYDVGAFDKVSGGGAYGVLPDKKKAPTDRYADPAVLSSDNVELRSGIHVQHTGVGTDYAQGL